MRISHVEALTGWALSACAVFAALAFAMRVTLLPALTDDGVSVKFFIK
jgi:hypothetical protein